MYKGLFPLRLRVALCGVAWREIIETPVGLSVSISLATQRNAQPRWKHGLKALYHSCNKRWS